MAFHATQYFRNKKWALMAAAIGMIASSAWLAAADTPPASSPQTQLAASTTQPAAPITAPAASDTPPVKGDLRELIGVNPAGLKRVEMPHMPSMTLRGFIELQGQTPLALLEITELNRVFLVRVGTEIPITIQGRVSPVGRSELTGLGDQGRLAGSGRDEAGEQSQIILKVLKVTNEGVTVEAGLLAQTIIIK